MVMVFLLLALFLLLLSPLDLILLLLLLPLLLLPLFLQIRLLLIHLLLLLLLLLIPILFLLHIWLLLILLLMLMVLLLLLLLCLCSVPLLSRPVLLNIAMFCCAHKWPDNNLQVITWQSTLGRTRRVFRTHFITKVLICLSLLGICHGEHWFIKTKNYISQTKLNIPDNPILLVMGRWKLKLKEFVKTAYFFYVYSFSPYCCWNIWSALTRMIINIYLCHANYCLLKFLSLCSKFHRLLN